MEEKIELNQLMDNPRLWIVTHKNEVEIKKNEFIIGRSSNSDYIIESIKVSRNHCIIRKKSKKWILIDQSINGTFVNNILYKRETCGNLRNNDRIKVENDEFIFKMTPDKMLEDICMEPAAKRQKIDDIDFVEKELICSVCLELFMQTVTLNCSHSFCSYCLHEWRRTHRECPICRKKIHTVVNSLVSDNIVAKILEKKDDNYKNAREELKKQRENAIETTTDTVVNLIDSSTDNMDFELEEENDNLDDSENEDIPLYEESENEDLLDSNEDDDDDDDEHNDVYYRYFFSR